MAESTCNVADLLREACENKFLCLDDKMARAVLLQLLCDILASGVGNQIVMYTAGTPANPPDVTRSAMAYDPNGILPSKGWNTITQTWN